MGSAGLGHIELTDQYGTVQVRETLTCSHCNQIFAKPGPADPAGFCHMCFKPVCLKCGKLDRCVPFEKKLEIMEQRARFLKQV